MKAAVRARVFSRDSWCRALQWTPEMWAWSKCEGPDEWAHFADHRRARTRGKAPEERHTTAGSLRLCRKHHMMYDGKLRPRLNIVPVDYAAPGCDGPGCDGLLEFSCGEVKWQS